MTENEINFLLGLRELTLKYGIVIEGCGCCGSPYLCEERVVDTSDNGGYALSEDGDFLKFLRPPSELDGEKYPSVERKWDKDKDRVVHPSKDISQYNQKLIEPKVERWNPQEG